MDGLTFTEELMAIPAGLEPAKSLDRQSSILTN